MTVELKAASMVHSLGYYWVDLLAYQKVALWENYWVVQRVVRKVAL